MSDREKEGQEGSLSGALGLGAREMVSLTGAGGKTSLMFRLALELSLEEKQVITTTTTKIVEPTKDESPHLLISTDEDEIRGYVRDHLSEYGHLTLAGARLEAGKLKGISVEILNHLWNSCEIDAMIVEADGAAGRPVKAPRDKEPVIPSSTTLVVAVLGLDGVEKELNDENVFQTEQVSRLTGIPVGTRMTEDGMAALMVHPEGLFKGTPPSSLRVAFLNKVDIPDGLKKGGRIAQKIFQNCRSTIARVILGQLKGGPPVAKVFFPEDN